MAAEAFGSATSQRGSSATMAAHAPESSASASSRRSWSSSSRSVRLRTKSLVLVSKAAASRYCGANELTAAATPVSIGSGIGVPNSASESSGLRSSVTTALSSSWSSRSGYASVAAANIGSTAIVDPSPMKSSIGVSSPVPVRSDESMGSAMRGSFKTASLNRAPGAGLNEVGDRKALAVTPTERTNAGHRILLYDIISLGDAVLVIPLAVSNK